MRRTNGQFVLVDVLVPVPVIRARELWSSTDERSQRMRLGFSGGETRVMIHIRLCSCQARIQDSTTGGGNAQFSTTGGGGGPQISNFPQNHKGPPLCENRDLRFRGIPPRYTGLVLVNLAHIESPSGNPITYLGENLCSVLHLLLQLRCVLRSPASFETIPNSIGAKFASGVLMKWTNRASERNTRHMARGTLSLTMSKAVACDANTYIDMRHWVPHPLPHFRSEPGKEPLKLLLHITLDGRGVLEILETSAYEHNWSVSVLRACLTSS